jgi:hypothetical protein
VEALKRKSWNNGRVEYLLRKKVKAKVKAKVKVKV